MTDLVHTRFVRDDPATRAFEQVNLVSSDVQMVEAIGGELAQRLSAAAERDAEFAAELSRWMTDAARVVNAEPADVKTTGA